MSIQLSQGEKIVREYQYAKTKKLFTTTEDTLIVTNKRIVHRREGHGFGSETVANSEMPIKNAKYVNTSYGLKSLTPLLILGIIWALIGLFLLVSGGGVIGFITLIPAAIFIIIYFVKKIYSCTCVISSETRIVPAFSLGTITYGLFGRKTGNGGMLLKIQVNNTVAKVLAEEIGAVIADVNNGVYDSNSFDGE